MKKYFVAFSLLIFSMKAVGQEGDSTKTKAQDSIVRVKLNQVLDSLLQHTDNDFNLEILNQKIKEISATKEKEIDKAPEPVGWTSKGQFSALVNQSAFNYDWQGGGTSNLAVSASLNYEANYKKNNLTWDNKLIAEYGLTFLKGEDFSRKTNDRIEITSRFGQRIGESLWNYSQFANFISQFAKGYEYTEDDETGDIIRTEQTHIFSPGFLQLGLGLLWKKSDDININIAPITGRIIIVDDQFTSGDDYEDGDYYGVDRFRSSRFEFGGSFSANLKYTVVKNITMSHILNLYSNYIEDPANIDIDYTLTINLLVNKYITGSFIFQAIYDDNATRAFQIREIVGLGLKYDF